MEEHGCEICERGSRTHISNFDIAACCTDICSLLYFFSALAITFITVIARNQIFYTNIKKWNSWLSHTTKSQTHVTTCGIHHDPLGDDITHSNKADKSRPRNFALAALHDAIQSCATHSVVMGDKEAPEVHQHFNSTTTSPPPRATTAPTFQTLRKSTVNGFNNVKLTNNRDD